MKKILTEDLKKQIKDHKTVRKSRSEDTETEEMYKGAKEYVKSNGFSSIRS